jgi:hypothetical protein
VHLRVSGYSMLPSILPGDALSIERRSVQEVSTGDLLLYCRKDRLFVHRVISAPESPGKYKITVRGDALPVPDHAVSPSEVLGTVSRISRKGKCFSPASRLKFSARVIGILSWQSDLFARLVVLVRCLCSMGWWRESHWTS